MERAVANQANAAPHPATITTTITARALSMDEGPRILQRLRSDRLRRPKGERGQCPRRIVTGVLWKAAGAHYEQVRHVPTLQVTVHRACRRVGAHDGAATKMRRLVFGYVVGTFAVFFDDLLGAHRLNDLGEFVGQKGVLL